MIPDKPITREEEYLAKMAGEAGTTPATPITRLETYLAKLAGQSVTLPDRPITRVECYLQEIIDQGGGGGGGGGDASEPTIYGFAINGSESDPSLAVTYLEDAVDMTPAHMDYATGKFEYGSWADAFFMPRPCMVRQAGGVDYYLDPDDYSKRSNGMSSDISNPDYAGNAMMEWGRDGRKIWYKIIPSTGGSCSVYISDRQMDPAYRAWSFINNKGEMVDHFYTPIYNGSSINGVMRSLSGQVVSSGLTGQDEITQCLANNPSGEELWYTETYADRVLITLLLILMGKSLNTQAVFGNGVIIGGQTTTEAYRTGALDTSGLFWGSSDTSHAVKVFGMENLWGLQWRRVAGLVVAEGSFKYRMTYGYNSDGADYQVIPSTVTGTNGTRIMHCAFDTDYLIPAQIGAEGDTYYTDGFWYNFRDTKYCLFGGDSTNGARCGIFACHMNTAYTYSYWSVGASLSYKPKGRSFP